MLITKVYIVVISATYVFSILLPLGIYFVTGTMEPILPVHLPFVRSDTIFGYMIHCIYNFKMATIAYLGISAADLFFITITMHIWPMVSILRKSVRRLKQVTQEIQHANDFETIHNSTWLRAHIRNILLMHREIYG